MTEPFFFGYGSLVNRRTHDYGEAYHARVRGWRRAWRHTHLQEVPFLTAVPDPQSEIEGLIAAVPGGDWAALDRREWGYDRHQVSHGLGHAAPRPVAAQIYAVPESRAAGPTVRHPILLSYLDVVVQGYLREFGESGAIRFFETTHGWDAPVRDDRADPRYPRAQPLSATELGFVDEWLATLGVRIIRG
ncbi:gamma-glutamylcyclotransferase [Rhodobacteraceae bacterium WD3A24]|nr:gamma-glutamylcyclotransferase [Rhodobacteraceae bacterium WD3A24]